MKILDIFQLWAWLSDATHAEVCCIGCSGLRDCGVNGVCERDWTP